MRIGAAICRAIGCQERHMARQRRAEFIKGAVNAAGLPKDGRPEIAFLGRSNVGKSSLVNLLLGRRELARTSNKPGKTRQLNYYLIDGSYYLVDLPGYGYAKVPMAERERWARVLTNYLLEHVPLRLVVHLIDSRHEPTPLDEQAMDVMAESPAGYVVVLTKSDKPKQRELAQHLKVTRRALADRGLESPVIATSAVLKRGDRELWRAIEAALATPHRSEGLPPAWAGADAQPLDVHGRGDASASRADDDEDGIEIMYLKPWEEEGPTE
jgi:GTP-binding protein